MASLKDVAKLAGVSVSTVSRVFNHSLPVDGKTQRRVEEAIAKLNYKPNLLAKGLRSRSGLLIGLVVPEIVHHTFASFIQYIEESAFARGYNLVIGNHKNNPDIEESFIDDLTRRHIDGIIFSRVSDESRVTRLLKKTGTPVVVIDRALEQEEVASVVLDNVRAGTLVGDHLGQLGHRKIACITGPLVISLCRERLAGLNASLEQYNARVEADWIFEGDFKFESGYEGGKQLFTKHPDLTAVWAQNDLMAVGVLKYLLEAGVSVPKDVSLVGMDDISLARMITPTLTTVAQPFAEICEKAVELLIKQKRGDGSRTAKIVIPPELVIRESTRAF
jgi:LacI family transcriptional regulator